MLILPLVKCQTYDVPVKRVHSRQRRFIAPGAVWDLMIGVEVIGSDFEFRYSNVIHYRMDYLFGGFEALTNAIAAAQAAASAEADALAAGRKKRLVLKLRIMEAFRLIFEFILEMRKMSSRPDLVRRKDRFPLRMISVTF